MGVSSACLSLSRSFESISVCYVINFLTRFILICSMFLSSCKKLRIIKGSEARG
jgi:hypothetical protein